MIVIFDDNHKSDLQFLTTLAADKFCKIALDFLIRGANKKLYTSAAQKLGVNADIVQRVVEGISHLFGEAARYMLSEVDFDSSLAVLAFPESVHAVLKELYFAHVKEIRTVQFQLFPHITHYVNLDWRLDVQLGSRNLRGPVIDPVFMLKLDTVYNNEPKTQYLQADGPSLRHLTTELETALNEIRSSDSRRVFRNMLGSGRLTNTPIAVDYFRFQPSVRAYFMSHMHTDHNDGLSPSWNAGPIYCSNITRKLLLAKFNIKPSIVHPLEVGVTSMVVLKNDVFINVTLIDANHCPGAVMFLFEGYFGTILHTGDFRYIPEMFNNITLQKNVVDHLYMDNTFCHPIFQMPPREDALKQVIEIITLHPNYRVVLGVDGLGKEDMLVALANHFKTLVVVSEERYCTIRLIDDIPLEVFTHQKDMGFIHTWPRTKITFKQVKEWNKEEPTIAIIPTGWTYKPYTSQHRFLGKPKQISSQQETDQKEKDGDKDNGTQKDEEAKQTNNGSPDTQTLSEDALLFTQQPSLSLKASSSNNDFATQAMSVPSHPPLYSPPSNIETLAPHQPESFEFEPLDSQSSVFFNHEPNIPSDSTQAFSSSQPNPLHTSPSSHHSSSPRITTGLTTQHMSIAQTQPTQSVPSTYDTLDPHQPQSFLFTESNVSPPHTSPSPSNSHDKEERGTNDKEEEESDSPPSEMTQQMTFYSTQPTQSPPSTQGTMDPHQPSLDFGYTENGDNDGVEQEMDLGEDKAEDEVPVEEAEQVLKEEVKVADTTDVDNKRKTNTKLIFWVPYSLHSSFSELSEFVQRLRPRQITPLVHNKFDPRTYFRKFLDPSPGPDFTMNPVLLFNQQMVQEASSRGYSPSPSPSSSTLSVSSFSRPISSSKELKSKLSSLKLNHPAQITPDPSIPIPTYDENAPPKKTPPKASNPQSKSSSTSQKVSHSKEMTEEEKLRKAKDAPDKNSETLRKLQQQSKAKESKSLDSKTKQKEAISNDEESEEEEKRASEKSKGKKPKQVDEEMEEEVKEKEEEDEEEEEEEKVEKRVLPFAKTNAKEGKKKKEGKKNDKEGKKNDKDGKKNDKEGKNNKEGKKAKAPKPQTPTTMSPVKQQSPTAPRRQSPRVKKTLPVTGQKVLDNYFSVVDKTPTKRKRGSKGDSDVEEDDKEKDEDDDWSTEKDKKKEKAKKPKETNKGKEKAKDKDGEKKSKKLKATNEDEEAPSPHKAKKSDDKARKQNAEFLANMLNKNGKSMT